MRSRLCLVGMLCAGMGSASAEVIERILAVVDGRPIVQSEVALLERVRGLEHATAVTAAIDERLMFQEAARLPQAAVSAEDEELAYKSLEGLLPASGELARSLRLLARRQAAILKYIDFRFRPQVRVLDAAVRQAYDAETLGREDAPAYELAAPEIRARLERKSLDEKIEAWVAELRASAEVRYNEPGPGEAPLHR
jgi:hypothetical protein